MKLLTRRKALEAAGSEAAPAAPEELAAQRSVLIDAVRSLLVFVQDFALELQELKTDAFRQQMADLSDSFYAGADPRSMQSAFDRKKKTIGDYIRRQKAYLRHSEAELRDIIELLTRAMIDLDADNHAFNEKMLVQSRQIEKITLLDDIKMIKKALLSEIDVLRESIHDKTQHDQQQIEVLAQKVKHLDRELKQTREASLKDGLTGIYNRKAFDAHMRRSLERSTVSKSPFSLLLIDIDDFKQINDGYGHQVGDRVLVAVAQKCASFIRSEDILARYGGEEFAILLNGASLRNAVKKARLICKQIAATSYALDGVKTGRVLSVTVSIGVSAFQKGDRPDDVIERADKALYAAKRAGKNRAQSARNLQ